MARAVTRPEWGAPPASFDHMGKVDTVFIHHSVTAQRQPLGPAMRDLEAHARALGHRAIDYSFVHFHDGQRAVGRGWFAQGGHTLNWNSRSYGLCATGDYRFDPITDALIRAFAETITEGIAKGALSSNLNIRPFIRPHSDVFATECPSRLREAIPRIRALIGQAPDTPTPPRQVQEQQMDILIENQGQKRNGLRQAGVFLGTLGGDDKGFGVRQQAVDYVQKGVPIIYVSTKVFEAHVKHPGADEIKARFAAAA